MKLYMKILRWCYRVTYFLMVIFNFILKVSLGEKTIRKICTSCGVSKKLDQFWKESKSKDGYCTRCIECRESLRAVRLSVEKGSKARRASWKKYEQKRRKDTAARWKETCRRKTKKLIHRGFLFSTRCIICGSEDVENHHGPDYDPLNIACLCRGHHMKLEGKKSCSWEERKAIQRAVDLHMKIGYKINLIGA